MPVRDFGYMASEAQMTLPISDAGFAGILDVERQFLRVHSRSGNRQRPTDDARPARNLKTRRELLSRSSPRRRFVPLRYQRRGARRRILSGKTPLLEFVRKGRDVTNITGEKLHVNQVIQAMEQAQAPPASCRDTTAVSPTRKNRATPSWSSSTALRPTTQRSGNCSPRWMQNLAQLNIEYAQKRASAASQAAGTLRDAARLVRTSGERRTPPRRSRHSVQSPTAQHDTGSNRRNHGASIELSGTSTHGCK